MEHKKNSIESAIGKLSRWQEIAEIMAKEYGSKPGMPPEVAKDVQNMWENSGVILEAIIATIRNILEELNNPENDNHLCKECFMNGVKVDFDCSRLVLCKRGGRENGEKYIVPADRVGG